MPENIFRNQVILKDIFLSAVKAVDPAEAVTSALSLQDGVLSAGNARYDLGRFRSVLVIGAGKATARMARGVEEVLGDRVDEGVIVVKYGHGGQLRRIRIVEAAHPVPDAAGLQGTRRVMDLVEKADAETLVISLLSGGGSALLVAPAFGLSLEDKQVVTDLLLRSGASIGELNAVRKHLSSVKGGRLARLATPATVLSLVISDVPGDRLEVIASGPLTPDTSTFGDAVSVLQKYGLEDGAPAEVKAVFQRGLSRMEPETPKAGDPCFESVSTVIIGSLSKAARAALQKALELGLEDPMIMSGELQGDVRDAARHLAGIALEMRQALPPGRKLCLVSGGETTVVVRGTGKGGRNQELALAFALEIEGRSGITLLSAGTDGNDGPTDAAGAIVHGGTARQGRLLGLDPEAFLGNNDSYAFFENYDTLTGEGAHLKTGPTGTNVMDLQLILIEREEDPR